MYTWDASELQLDVRNHIKQLAHQGLGVPARVMRDLYEVEVQAEAPDWPTARRQLVPALEVLAESIREWAINDKGLITRVLAQAARQSWLAALERTDVYSYVPWNYPGPGNARINLIVIDSVRLADECQAEIYIIEDNWEEGHLTPKRVRMALTRMRQRLNDARRLALAWRSRTNEEVLARMDQAVLEIEGCIEAANRTIRHLKEVKAS